MFKLAKIIRRDLFFNQTVLSRQLSWGDRRGENSEIQNAVFSKRKKPRDSKLLQPGVGKNSKDLTILILEFDDVTVKTIYTLFSYKNLL